MITFRKATGNDLEKLLKLIEAGFSVQFNSLNRKEGWEHRVLFSYLFNHTPANIEQVYLAEEQGFLVAAVGLIPQQLYFEGIKIPVRAISPVVTHPRYRGQGVAGKCLRETLEDLQKQGISAVFLWGLPDYYPRFGFVPLLPRYKTKLTLTQIREQKLGARARINGNLRIFKSDDLELISDLYNRGNQRFWLQPEREFSWWRHRVSEMDMELGDIKEVPFPKKENFVVWENHMQEVCGYLYYEISPGQVKIIVKEGAARDGESALEMLQSFTSRYLKPNWTLYIRGTPEHLLNIAAYRLGGTHLNPTPLAGMLKIIQWPVFLNQIKPLINQRCCTTRIDIQHFYVRDYVLGLGWDPADGLKIELGKSSQTNSFNDETGLIRLIIGYYDQMDFENSKFLRLKALFPPKYPFIWDANYLY
jgi:predicted N-acetyltransferase YhbS